MAQTDHKIALSNYELVDRTCHALLAAQHAWKTMKQAWTVSLFSSEDSDTNVLFNLHKSLWSSWSSETCEVR